MNSVYEGPFLFNCADLPRRAGEMREYELTFDVHEPLGIPLFAVPEDEPIEVDLRLQAVEEGVLASATVRALAVGECIRCLDRVEQEVEEDFHELYIYESDPRSRSSKRREVEVIVDDEDPVLTMQGDYIDLEAPIRDAIILNLPVNPLCDEDCLGLCPGCGVKWDELAEDHGHDQVDIRWAGLEKLAGLQPPESPEASA
jgi:uncharacterized protein